MNDDDLRALLHDAVSDVRPERDLDDLLGRTDSGRSGRRGWFTPALAAAAVTAALIAGIAGTTLGGRDDTPVIPGSSTTPAPSGAALPVYFVGDAAPGPRLYREFLPEKACPDVGCELTAAVSTALAGAAEDPDYRSDWPAGTTASDATYAGGTITVDLSGPALRNRPASMTAAQASLAVQQVVYTAQAVVGQGRLPVQLLLDGGHTDRILGVPAAEPLAADPSDAVLAPVWITQPSQGASVTSPFTVKGLAMSFEANVGWELVQGDTVVRSGFTTAAECCTRSPYSFRVSAPPGEYTLVVHDSDPSGGEGPGVSPETKQITVTASADPSTAPVRLTAAGASAGGPATIGWISDRTLHLPTGAVTLPARYVDAVGYHGGWLALRADGTLDTIAADGSLSSSAPSDPGSRFAISPDGTRVTWFQPGSGGRGELRSGLASGMSDGEQVLTLPAGSRARPIGYGTGSEVVYQLDAADGSRSVWVTDFSGSPRRLTGALSVGGTSAALDEVAVQTSVSDSGSCWELRSLADGNSRARTCDYSLGQFSSDGRYVIGWPAYADGLGPRDVAVLDARTLKPVVRFQAPAGTAGYVSQAVWDGDTDTLVAALYENRSWQLVRLTKDGGIETVSDPIAVPDDTTVALRLVSRP